MSTCALSLDPRLSFAPQPAATCPRRHRFSERDHTGQSCNEGWGRRAFQGIDRPQTGQTSCFGGFAAPAQTIGKRRYKQVDNSDALRRLLATVEVPDPHGVTAASRAVSSRTPAALTSRRSPFCLKEVNMTQVYFHCSNPKKVFVDYSGVVVDNLAEARDHATRVVQSFTN